LRPIAGGGPAAPRPLATLLILAALFGCGPSYESSIRLQMPRPLTAEARECLTRCDGERDACYLPARQEFAACSERAILIQDQCRANGQIDYQICQRAYAPDGQNCFYPICQRQSCAPIALDACDADYRRCFAECGGTVIEEQRCVANCPS
jgi:hypothetical protein